MPDDRILRHHDQESGIVRLSFNNPGRRNTYDPAMRDQLAAYLDEAADDDDVKVVHLRGEGGVFSTGADMGNAYAWYGSGRPSKDAQAKDAQAKERRPSQRRRLTVDRHSFGFYHNFIGFPKVTVAEVSGFALGGGFELALAADIAVVARDARIGMPAARFLGPALGSLHLFFHRLGPVLARRMLLTGDIIEAADLEPHGVFTEFASAESVPARATYWARKAARMPADGIVLAKEAFRLVEQLQAYQGEEVFSYITHAFGTNLRFEEGEFNFVKTRAEHGTKEAFRLRDEYFDISD
jgi:enoyl-CoA hydratase/carnithine racemase